MCFGVYIICSDVLIDNVSYKAYNKGKNSESIYSMDIQSIQVAQLKSHFSDVLKTIKNDGKKFIIEYGKQHEKIAMIVPYDKNLEIENEREFGLYKDKGSFVIKNDFSISDEEFLKL